MGFMEPEFQVAQSKGENSFSGGNFPSNSNNRFIIRRGRIRTQYLLSNKKSQPVAEMCFEFDGTQRGVTINEFWGKLYENKWQLFSVGMGMMVRPFSNEINVSTRNLVSPERARMSQTLMRGEVDLGGMLVFEPRNTSSFFQFIKFSAGVFNGQGLTGPAEYDSFKDFISRVSVKPVPVGKKFFVSGGMSAFTGGIVQNNQYVYHTVEKDGMRIEQVDSSFSNIGKKAPRKYFDADIQLKYQHQQGASELRAEYWWGRQTGTGTSSETPNALLTEPYFVRRFNGGIFYLLHFFLPRHQLVVKYDWYDPNTDVKKEDIGKANANFTIADIKFSTLGFGYIYYMNTNLKLMLWYDIIKNESTSLTEYKNDFKDNVLTCRLQLRF